VQEPLSRLTALIPDGPLQAAIRGTIDGRQYLRRLRAGDIIMVTDTAGVSRYSIRPEVLHALFLPTRTLAAIYLCAANNFSPLHGTSDIHIPLMYPGAAEQEAGGRRLPHLSFYMLDIRALHHTFPTFVDAARYFRHLQAIGIVYLYWMAGLIRRSITKGLDSVFNWGAYWRLSKIEFLARVAPQALVETREVPPSYSESNRALILHPTHSNYALAARLIPYDPTDHHIDLPNVYWHMEDFSLLARMESQYMTKRRVRMF
jgi:hypothetical protein